jgi:aspartyl-tRNA(Asn)/glutamyl-tRNA(Gln) amidotransferase subunit B
MSTNEYKLTVGLEVHAELSTKTKMFCDSRNDADEVRPNVNVCPVCMGHPGTLPVINKEAVRSVLRLGVAVGGELADYTEFDRKNYFYPDIPKGYQISQYKFPLVKGGKLAGVDITRVHLEEDTARSTHDKGEESLLDFNRAGVPLMELVTEPVIHEPETASQFAKELQLTLLYLGISHANMEKGEMRVEANVSINMGTKVEVKNLNSFKAVEKAIKYEYERQKKLIESGEKVVQETRGWDENRGETFSQRVKEESHDYRYFPDPDLPKLFIREIAEFSGESLRVSMPELPQAKRDRLAGFGISVEHVENYVRDNEMGEYFDKVTSILNDNKLIQLASNFINTDLKSFIDPGSLVEIVSMTSEGDISTRAAKDIIKMIEADGGSPRVIAQEKNLLQISDREELRKILGEVRAENPDAPAQYVIGQAMKKSQGRANPVVLQELFLEMSDN